MAEAVVRYGKETWVGSGNPTVNHNDANRLRLKSGEALAFLNAKSPVPPGLTVVEAYYVLRVAKPTEWAGTKTLKLRRADKRVPYGKMTWDNKPGVTGSSQPTVAVTNPVLGQELRFNVTTHLQAVANGSPHYGWRLETDSATAHRVWGYDSDYPPVLEVTYALSPAQPVDLSPAGGAVSVAKPILTFDSVDYVNPGDMAALRVQFDAAGDFTSGIDWDSGEVASSVPQLDLATTTYPGLAAGASTYWRAQIKSGEGVWGEWSDPVSFSRTAKGTLTITNPVAGSPAYVTEATPPFMHSFTGTQVAWKKWVTPADDHTEIIVNSRKTDGADTSWTPAKAKLKDGETYTLHVAVWDDVDRVATPGDPIYTKATRDFVVNDVPGVPSPVMVSATQDGGTPFVVLEWTRAEGAPDSWTIRRDGDTIATLIDPDDTLVTGTTHRWTDHTAPPQEPHTYRVKAVENGESSPPSNGASVTTNPEGVWLLDPDHGLYVTLGQTGVDNWQRTDQVTLYTPIGAKPVTVFFGDNGISGNFEGTLEPVEGRTTAQWRGDFETMAKAARRGRVFQLVAAWLSIPVTIRNGSATPHPDTQVEYPMDLARFEFTEGDQ